MIRTRRWGGTYQNLNFDVKIIFKILIFDGVVTVAVRLVDH